LGILVDGLDADGDTARFEKAGSHLVEMRCEVLNGRLDSFIVARSFGRWENGT
jgi:hypothetical protein